MKKRTLSFTLILAGLAVLWLPQIAAAQLQRADFAAFIWTDKQVYLPGESITVRWTAQANGDANVYAVVAYLQNNQSGEKKYMNWLGGISTTPTDIAGNTPEAFSTFGAGTTTKSVIIGPGGWLRSSLLAPEEYGMHTIAMEFRDGTGKRPVKTLYAKFGIVQRVVTLSGNIIADRKLLNTEAYNLSGVVLVTNGATLTIEPGTFIFGQPGSQPPSMLLIGVNGKIIADGTRSRPITMTSSQPVGQRAPGDWGGLVLLGRAQVNVQGGVNNIEGLPPSADTTYGGADNTHNCGTLRYLRVEFGGSILSPNNEINNITFGGCGNQTVVDHVVSRYGLDDLFEWFGGVNSAKYLVGQGSRDDNLDGQLGWSGSVQHAVIMQGTDVKGNRGIEMDNSEFDDRAAPQGQPKFYNITFVGSGDVDTTGFDESDSSAIYLRRGAGGEYMNMILFNWIVNGVSVRTNSGSTATHDSIVAGNLKMNGMLMWNNGKASGRPNTLDGQAADFGTTNNADGRALVNGTIATGNGNSIVVDPMMRRPLYPSDPDFLPRVGSPIFRANWVQPPDDGFLDQWARWNGAFGDEDWTEEWVVWAQESEIKP